jgi:Tol biopolymer transport system component
MAAPTRLSLASFSVVIALASACGEAPPLPARPVSGAAQGAKSFPGVTEEAHLTDVRQLTFGGENAEAYWSWDGRELILQARKGDADCDRIFRMPVAGASAGAMVPVSSGKGATTCSYFMPGNQDVIYASTHLGGEACPPKPDHSQGYVWALYDSYDIFKAKADGGGVVRLTDTPGYDAEATVCEKDGSIVFTSVRDGDIELYRMDADGKNVKRLTSTPGYDGGAFFNKDCSKIVWRASRPKPGKELDDFKGLLAKGLVRPSKLELYVANADGSDAQQITYLNAASFAPYWHPSQRRILFSSNFGDPKGREFNIWAIDVDGKNLEQITFAPGFDGFPMFSPDGTTLAFSSNRATAQGKHDTNVFLARWVEGSIARKEETAADRVAADIAWLADPAREGRGVGTRGLDESGAFLEKRMQSLGLQPAGDNGTFRQVFQVPTELKSGEKTQLSFGGKPVGAADFAPLGFSAPNGEARGDLVFAGYGIAAKDLDLDEYAKLDVKKKIVLVRRFVPDDKKLESTDAKRRHGDLRKKAWTAKERGAIGLVVVDDPPTPDPAPKDWKPSDEAKFPALQPEGYGDAGIPVAIVKRAIGHDLVERLQKKQKVAASMTTQLTVVTKDAFNVVGRVAAEPEAGKKLPGVLVLGAHYDHLGHGGRYSLAPGKDEPHVGADDNASGTAALMEAARELATKKKELKRDVVFVAFSGEESGVLGSSHFTRASSEGKNRAAGPKEVYAMLNMDMVGRLRENRMQVLGVETAAEWGDLVQGACDGARVVCAPSTDGGGYGPSDQMPFFLAGAPVLHLFTGTHFDYHKPTDTASRINAAGTGQAAKITASIATALAVRESPLTYKADARGPAPRGDLRSFNASLGTVPDYAGPGAGKKGVLLAGVRPGGAAEKAGLQRGDVLVRLGTHEVASIEDFMYVLNASKPGETAVAVVLRDGKEIKLEVTFQESQRPK